MDYRSWTFFFIEGIGTELLECIDDVTTGYSPEKSTGDTAADQYHHYKVIVKSIWGRRLLYLGRITQCAI
jgi:hypothetical protein